MANDRKYTLQKLEELKLPIADHLTYVVAFPGVQEQKHWRKELWTFFKRVNDLTDRSKVDIPRDISSTRVGSGNTPTAWRLSVRLKNTSG
jgi:hypothetical protein